MAFYGNILEEELKNKVAHDYFSEFDTTQIVGKIDFCIAINNNSATPTDGGGYLFDTQQFIKSEHLLWAEAKSGDRKDIYKSFVQLILTIGKARTFDQHLPPAFLGAFDAEKIGFIPYNYILDIFYQTDFNWNVTPSNHETKEFQQVYSIVKNIIESNVLLFHFEKDDKELRAFIKRNFVIGKSQISKIRVNKNNFVSVYQKWLKEVKPSIIANWEVAKKNNILDADFYLADLLSKNNTSLKDKLYVLLEQDHYLIGKQINQMGLINSLTAEFNDKQVAHTQFWNRYIRPPKQEYWDYIIGRRDLLVPQDVRERKGSFFTPQKWVELSQQYIADVLGENWQDEYYIWDCCAGTGNLLNGLTNKYNIWASTLDMADVDVMRERIKNGANLLESHIFQFDFLNDDFSMLPQGLQEIINDPDKRKKLVIYINPPYAEATSATTVTGTGQNKAKVATENNIAKRYKSLIGNACNELFAQFFIRIQQEVKGCVLAEFSTLKILQAPNFAEFRKIFSSKLEKIFVVPADTFDNVKGQFPIGFMVWNTNIDNTFTTTHADIFNHNAELIGQKRFFTERNSDSLNTWIRKLTKNIDNNHCIGHISFYPSDFQNNKMFSILSKPQKRYCISINKNNLFPLTIYYAVRKSIEASWLNDRDQFFAPNQEWAGDTIFQNNCLIYTLFHGQNNITSSIDSNHWIPFTEQQVDAKDCFESHFMSNYLAKIGIENLSAPAKAVYEAGLELWRYYHTQPNANPNASLYDIREHFQGRNDKGKMNNDSNDSQYTALIGNLRSKLKELAKEIEPKVYEYGFLKQ